MAYVSAKCPNCGGSIQIDNERKEGYCIYCGSLIKYQEVIEKLKFVKHTKGNLENLIELINKSLENGTNQSQDFKTLLYRALEQDPDNQYLKDLQTSEIWNAKIFDGNLISYDGNVEKIVLPNCIMIINENAFRRCYSLKEITLSPNVVKIKDKAFFGEENLRINAYKNSYAAKYALASPAYLNLIDSKENYQKLIDEIETDLHKLIGIKDSRIKTIKSYYIKDRKFLVVVGYVFFIFLMLFSFTIMRSKIHITFTVAGVIGILFSIIMLFSIESKIQKICNKKRDRLVNRYYINCNIMLRTYGFEDFELVKDLSDCSYEELSMEARKLRNIIAKVRKVDKDYFI